jgi:hypothetical protein
MLFERMMRAARLDVNLYEEVEADTTLTSQAAQVVLIVALCQGIGSAIGVAMNPDAGGVGAAIAALVLGIVLAFVGWVIWAYITYWVGTGLFGGTATPGEMLRTLGFAQSPGVLGIVSFIPCLGGLIALAAAIWALIAGIIAIRQALDFDTGKAIVTAIIGWFVVLIFSVMLAVFTGGLALMGRALTG